MSRVVLGEGPIPARVFVLGEAPGDTEDRTGRPFMGKSGDVLDRYWGRQGVPHRADVYLTNVVKVRPVDPRTGKNRKPTAAEIADWAPVLHDEITACQPSVIVTLGATATRLFLDHDLDAVHGIPHLLPFDGEMPRVIFPAFHPAATLHDPSLQALLTYDFQQLGAYLKGQIQARVRRSPTLDITDGGRDFHPSTTGAHYLALDTEGWTAQPWGLSYCDHPWVGAVVRRTQGMDLALLVDAITQLESQVVLHYALHDLPVLRALGIDLIAMGVPIHDTMVAAYLLGLEPRGLKALGYRHLGMVMDSYSDLTAEAETRVALQYLCDLVSGLPDKPTPKSKRKKADIAAGLHTDADNPLLVDLGKAKDLITRMLCGPHDDLRTKWANGRAREIVIDQYALCGDMPRTTLDDVDDQARVVQYAGADAIATRGVFFPLMEQIDAFGLRDCYDTTCGIIPMIDRMQQVGMLVDRGHFQALGPVLDARGADLDAQITAMVGTPINCNSGDQIAPLLFDRLKLQHKVRNLRLKKTDGGRYSTDDKTLEALEDTHPVVPLIRARREVTKLRGTYVTPAESWIGPDGRLHPTLKLTTTDTGRLSAEDPNILAFPKHSEWGRLIRYGFIAAPGHVLLSCDLDQIEMRVFAHDSGDAAMIAEFLSGRDKHASTAALIFGRPYEELFAEYKMKNHVAEEQRFAAKCFHPDTEVLTRRGWVRILDLAEGEEVVQAHPNRDTDVSLSWTTPLDVFAERAKEGLIHFTNESMDIRVTPDHRMLGWKTSGEWYVAQASEFANGAQASTWACAGVLRNKSGQKLPLHSRLRVAVALQADGCIRPEGSVTWGFSKARKIKRLRALLEEADIVYRERTSGRVTTFTISKGHITRIVKMLDPDKTLPWSWLNYPVAWRETILDEARYWDSHRGEHDHRYSYSSTHQKNIDVLQALAAVTGRKSTAVPGTARPNPKHRPCHTLSIKDRAHAHGGTLEAAREPYVGVLACLSVPSSFILVRYNGKTLICGQSVNFGVLMGITEHGLRDQFHKNGQLHWTTADCSKLLDEWRKAYPAGYQYQSDKHAEARRYGYVRDMFGRLRWVDGVHSDDPYQRAEAERQAQATPIQSGAQGILQRVMRALWPELVKLRRELWVEPLLQIHDDLLFELEESAQARVTELVLHYMANTVTLRVPVTAKPASGHSWGEL